MACASCAWEERALRDSRDLAARARLLESRGLSVPGGEELILGFFDGELLVATGSLVGKIIQGVAVLPEYEGSGAAAIVVTALIKAAVARGLRHLFLYSKPAEARRFEALGLSPIASVEIDEASPAATDPCAVIGGADNGATYGAVYGAALLEWGQEGIGDWCRHLALETMGKPEGAGVVVVNCNPFTLGHRYLIERAAAEVPWLYVLVVQENRSLFPFEVRIDLVRRGTRDIPHLSVLPGGPYVISSATFPTYFTRPRPGTEDALIAGLHATLDLEIFRTYIAPALKASERFVGTEPYCPTTAAYNRIMLRHLTAPGARALRVREIPRLEREGGAISASRVREAIRRDSLAEVRDLVPESTWDWLNSPAALPVLERIKKSDSRH